MIIPDANWPDYPEALVGHCLFLEHVSPKVFVSTGYGLSPVLSSQGSLPEVKIGPRTRATAHEL